MAKVPVATFETAWVEFFARSTLPGSETVARVFSHLGGEWFYLALIPLLLWRGPWGTAVKVARAMIFADLAGEWIKWTLMRPRPPAELALSLETSPGFVSTHAALSMAVGVVLYLSTREKRRVLLLVWILGVAWSRLRLGVHYPLDILGGWGLGLLVGIAASRWGGDRRAACLLSLAVGTLLALLWPEGGQDSIARDLGLLLGLEAGLLGRVYGSAEASPPERLPNRSLALKAVGLFAIYFGFKAAGFPRLFRYFALGLWAVWRSRKKT